MILDCKKISGKKLSTAKKYVSKLAYKPALAIISVGNDAASKVYVNNKKKACEAVGIECKHFAYKETISQDYIITMIQKLNANQEINGIIVQLPLPKWFDEHLIINSISPTKDVDCLTDVNLMALLNGNNFYPCTPKGVKSILDYINVDPTGKTAVVIGRSKLAGQSIQIMLNNMNATTILCHSKTQNLKQLTQLADIVVSCVGEPNLIKKDMIKNDSIIIDVGISRTSEGLKGDASPDVANKAKVLTPVPGGVGVMTVASLIENLLILAKQQEKASLVNIRRDK